jgi:hypothetical protein
MARRISWHRNAVVIATVPLALLVLGCSSAGNAGTVPDDPNANGGGASSGATVGDDGASGGGTGSTGGSAGSGDDAASDDADDGGGSGSPGDDAGDDATVGSFPDASTGRPRRDGGARDASTGPARDAGVPDASTGAGTDAGAALAAARAQCVQIINQDRATLNPASPPLTEDTAEEACVDGQAQADFQANKAHSAFGNCKESAQDECPNWPGPPSAIMTKCLAQMWAEGPPAAGQDNHWLNMSNAKYKKVACGFFQTPTGSWWATQDFY